MGIATAWLSRIKSFFGSSGAQARKNQAYIVEPVLAQLALDKALFRAHLPVDVHIVVAPDAANLSGVAELADCLSIQCIELREKIQITLGHSTATVPFINAVAERSELRKRLEYIDFFNGTLNTLSNCHSASEKVRFMRFITIKCRELECTLFKMREIGEIMTATAAFDGYLQYSETGKLSTSLDAICESMDKVFQGSNSFSFIDPEKYRLKNRIRGFCADSSRNLELVAVIETVVEDFSQSDLISILEAPEIADGCHVVAISDLTILLEHADAYEYEVDPMCAAAVSEILLAPPVSMHPQSYSAN